VLVCGSLYLVGEIKGLLRGRDKSAGVFMTAGLTAR
jgi:hypothetical protein